MCVCVRERECVCVCVCERETQRESVCMCVLTVLMDVLPLSHLLDDTQKTGRAPMGVKKTLLWVILPEIRNKHYVVLPYSGPSLVASQ